MSSFDRQEKEPCLLKLTEKGMRLNPKIAVEFYTTHGIPTDLWQDWVNDLFKDSQAQKMYHTLRAFDEARGTNNRMKIRDFFNENVKTTR